MARSCLAASSHARACMTASINLRRQVEVDDLPGPDFTIYSNDEPKLETQEEASPGKQTEKIGYSYDGPFAIKVNGAPDDAEVETGRGLACRAYADHYWSITLRCDANP